jgi:hypothetical protein
MKGIIVWCAKPGCSKKLVDKNGNPNKNKVKRKILCGRCGSLNEIIHDGNGKIKTVLKEETNGKKNN